MKIEEAGGIPVALDILDPMDPVLDVSPSSFDFTSFMIRKGHFTFCVDGNPTSSRWRMTGSAKLRHEIVSRSRAGTVIYATDNGMSWTVNSSAVETKVSAKIDYVRSLDLTSFSNEVGIEQWGVIRLGRNVDEILADFPGSIAKEIVIPWGEYAGLSFEAKSKISEWYEWVGETLLVQRGFVK